MVDRPAAPSPVQLVLASASPRRLELLRRLGLEPQVCVADADERVRPGEPAEAYVARVATDKAAIVGRGRRGSLVIAADTAVVLDGEPLGKPDDPAHALELLERLCGREHRVLTAVTVLDPDGRQHSGTATARVRMAPTTAAEREWYVSTGEPLDKAGAYAVQGRGAALVERVEGDPTTVVGLPLRLTVELLRTAGLDWPG